ncbi:hypothetical protein V8C42DRAFT_335254 [Trichoderma barbatum]
MMKRQTLDDEKLRIVLTPHYTLGCKMVLLSDDFYVETNQPHVRVVKTLSKGLAPTECEFSFVVFATGFRTTQFMFPIARLGAVWMSFGANRVLPVPI